jgi:hypothetical protein
MPTISLVRIAAFLATVAVSAATNQTDFVRIVIYLGLAHYGLSVWYARKNLKLVLSHPVRAVSLTGAVAFAFWSYVNFTNLILWFLPHHVFNEVYLTKKQLLSDNCRVTGTLLLSAIALNSVIYAKVLGLHQFGDVVVGDNLILSGLAISLTCFLFSLYKWYRLHGIIRTIDACCVEVIGLAALLISKQTSVSFLHIILYHVIFWALYPLVDMYRARNTSGALAYLKANVGAVTALILVGPLSVPWWHLSDSQLYQLFLLASFVHIASSYMLSRAQPEWIWKLFLPLPTAAPTVVPPQVAVASHASSRR